MNFKTWTRIITLTLFTALTLVPTLPAQAKTLTVLNNFTGVPDGHAPTGGLLLDAAGNLYPNSIQSTSRSARPAIQNRRSDG